MPLLKVVVLVIVAFLNNGDAITHSVLVKDWDSCKENLPLVEQDLIGKKVYPDMNSEESALVIDVQGSCIEMTKGTNA